MERILPFCQQSKMFHCSCASNWFKWRPSLFCRSGLPQNVFPLPNKYELFLPIPACIHAQRFLSSAFLAALCMDQVAFWKMLTWMSWTSESYLATYIFPPPESPKSELAFCLANGFSCPVLFILNNSHSPRSEAMMLPNTYFPRAPSMEMAETEPFTCRCRTWCTITEVEPFPRALNISKKLFAAIN